MILCGMERVKMRLASIALMTAITALAGSSSTAEEKQVQLREAPGLDKVESHCSACHSLDYVQMNSRFLSAAGWEAEIAKMINAFGAQIDQDDAKTIADYLNKNYGIESFSLEKDQGIVKPTSYTPGRSFKAAGVVKRVAKHTQTREAQVQSVAPAPPVASTPTLEERPGLKMGM
jgi:cytochrome c5